MTLALSDMTLTLHGVPTSSLPVISIFHLVWSRPHGVTVVKVYGHYMCMGAGVANLIVENPAMCPKMAPGPRDQTCPELQVG